MAPRGPCRPQHRRDPQDKGADSRTPHAAPSAAFGRECPILGTLDAAGPVRANRREHAVLSFFRLGDGWTRPGLQTVNGRFQRRLSVEGIDPAGLAWDGRTLRGTVTAQIGRVNPHRDYGEGENMHSMLKAQRRAVMNWSLGGRKRLFPSPHTFTLEARLGENRRVLELRFEEFAGDRRPGRMPTPDDTTRMRPGEADEKLFARPREPSS